MKQIFTIVMAILLSSCYHDVIRVEERDFCTALDPSRFDKLFKICMSGVVSTNDPEDLVVACTNMADRQARHCRARVLFCRDRDNGSIITGNIYLCKVKPRPCANALAKDIVEACYYYGYRKEKTPEMQ